MAASLYIKRENASLLTDTSHLKTFLIRSLIISHKSSQMLSFSNEMRNFTSCTGRTSCTTWQSPLSRQLCSQGGSIERQVHQRPCKWDAVLLCDTSYNKYPPFTTKIKWMTKAFQKKRRNCNLINKFFALILETAILLYFFKIIFALNVLFSVEQNKETNQNRLLLPFFFLMWIMSNDW